MATPAPPHGEMLQTHAEGAEEPGVGLTAATLPHFGHDFSQIPIHAPAAGAIQTKLAISKLGDEYEQEADRISEQVMRMPEPQLQRACACGGGCPNCQAEQPGQENERLQAKRVASSDLEQTAVPPMVHEALRSPGQPLDPATRGFVEPRFGYDFSQVRVHCGTTAEQSAGDVNAHAYTVGHNVVFGAGRFAPGTHQGLKLIAHELTHVVQQSGPDQQGKALRSSVTGTRDSLQRPPNAPLAPARSLVAGTDFGRALQRAPVTEKRRFTPTRFSDTQVLITAVVKDSPKQEDLVGACNYLDALPMARTLSLLLQIAARKPAAAVAALQATALQGWGTSHVRAALAAVMLKGEISRVGFAAEHASSNDLAVLPAQDAAQVLDVLGPTVPELAAMQQSKGFQALRPDEQARLTFLIGGSTSLSVHAPAALRTVLADRRANKDDPATFRKFLTDEKYQRFHPGLPSGKARQRDPFTVRTAVEVPNYAFGGQGTLTANAIRYDVVIDAKDATGKDFQQTIPVFIPKSGGPKDKRYQIPTINEVAETLASTPDVSRSKIVHVDMHWMTESSAPDTGGPPPDNVETKMAAGADGVVNIYPIKNQPHDRATLAMSLIHETGHTASLAAWGDSDTDKRWDPWRAAMKADGMAVSQYSKESLDDDFAESWAFYVPVVGTPREAEVRALIPARCKLMDTLLWQKPVP
jgi:hypothetical protein